VVKSDLQASGVSQLADTLEPVKSLTITQENTEIDDTGIYSPSPIKHIYIYICIYVILLFVICGFLQSSWELLNGSVVI